MKNLRTPGKLKLAVIGVMAMFCLLQFSCLKDDNHYVATPTALLLVTQASPDAPAEQLALDNNRVNQGPFNYNDYIGYFNAYTGKRNAILYNYSTLTKIASDTITLHQNTAYSLFLSNSYTNPDYTLITDSLAQPASGMGTVRLVNVSPDAGSVDLVANGTTLVSNKAYRAASVFKPVTGNQTYNFSVVQSGTSTVLAKLDTITIRAGSVYTIWLHGKAAGTGTAKLSADIMKNAFY